MKNRFPASEQKERRDNLYSRLRGDIVTMRKQGNFPEKDPSTFSKYYCDLCNDSFPLNEIKQCTLCGRWACSSCWTQDFYVCNSCNGVIKLHTMTFKNPVPEEKED
ncbi:hypothetical protein [Methanochimaera problematica]|uniref:hypothetical protein n=1 Tax=Methanochimaera problematica TaxID=2609417 RepID=UPI0038CDA920